MKITIKKLKIIFQCSSIAELAELLAISRDTLFKAQRWEAGRHTIRSLKIIEILTDNMSEKQLQKSLKKIRFLDSNII